MSETPSQEERAARFTIIEAAGYISEQLNRLPGEISYADNAAWQISVFCL